MKLNNEIVACTYFDKNYLIKGLSMATSFLTHNPNIKLYILCFDDYTRRIVESYGLENLVTISLKDFEDRELLKVKPKRSLVEYYWTCTPSLPLYVFKKYPNFKKVIYLDADLFFYSSVDKALEELGNGSIYTVEHRYPRGQAYRNLTSGRFNVAFQIFTKKRESLQCLERWRSQCLRWCYYKVENGKMGDQMYLNEWSRLYKNLVVSRNVGVDAAPWNISQYLVTKDMEWPKINNERLICYHFHQFSLLSDREFELSFGYLIQKNVKEYIYKPYINNIKEQIRKIKKIDSNFTIQPIKRSKVDKVHHFIIKRIAPLYWTLQTCFFALTHPRSKRANIASKIAINALSYKQKISKKTDLYVEKIMPKTIKNNFKKEYLIFCNQENDKFFREYNNCLIIKLPFKHDEKFKRWLFKYIFFFFVLKIFSVDKSLRID